MTEQTRQYSRTAGWLMFLVSLIALILLLVYLPEGFWLALPTTTGGLVMGLDWV